jgi:hypothetical protein
MAEPRRCITLIVSTRVRSETHSSSYRPFNRKYLGELFAEAAESVKLTRRQPKFEEHAVFPYFFFGEKTLTEEKKKELRKLPASIVDCDIYRTADDDVLDTAESAMIEFYAIGGDRKTFFYVCGDGCKKALKFDHWRAKNDSELYAFLTRDLADNTFDVLGNALKDGS